MNRGAKISIGLFLTIFVFIVSGFLYYRNLSPELMPTNITIESTIQKLNENEYMVELQVNQEKDDYHSNMIYPIIPGKGNISFIQDDDLFTPSSIGNDHASLQMLTNEISNMPMAQEPFGFGIPGMKGIYNMKFTVDALSEAQENLNPKIYYIHKEKRYGKDLSWIKGFEMTVE